MGRSEIRESGHPDANWTEREGANIQTASASTRHPCFIWVCLPEASSRTQLGLTKRVNALPGVPGHLASRASHADHTSSPSSKDTARPSSTLRGRMGVERGKSRVLPLAPLDRGGGLQQTNSLRRRSSPLRCFVGLSHSPHCPGIVGPESLTWGRWQSSGLKRSRACKLPLKSLRTWWLARQACGREGRSELAGPRAAGRLSIHQESQGLKWNSALFPKIGFPHQGLGMKPTKFLLDSPIEKVPQWPPQKEPSRLHRSFVVSLTTNEAVPT